MVDSTQPQNSPVARPKVPYDFGASIAQPFRMPGGKSLMLRIAFWMTLLYALIFALFGGKVVAGYIKFFALILEAENTSDPDAAALEAMSSMFSMMGYFTLLWLGSWAVKVSAETAMHKNIFKGYDGGLFPLRFGTAEWRVVLAQLVVYVLTYGVYMAGYFVAAIFIFIAVAVGQSSVAAGIVFGIIAAIAVIAAIIAILMALIRLSPAAALSVRDDEIRTIEGLKATKGRFWSLFGSTIVVYLIGSFVISIIMLIFVLMAFGDFSMFSELSEAADSEPEAVMSMIGDIFKSPRVMIPLIIGGIITTFLSVIWYLCYWGIPNYAAQLDALDNGNVEETFS